MTGSTLTMDQCEYCMTWQDLQDFSSRNNYVVALGFKINKGNYVHFVEEMPESRLRRYESGDYDMGVIESHRIPPSSTKQEASEMLESICRNYGSLDPPEPIPTMTHEERMSLAAQVAANTVKVPFVDSVYLTGSTMSGHDRPISDIDLIVVLEQGHDAETHTSVENIGSSVMVDFYYMGIGTFLRAKESMRYPLVNNARLLGSK